MNMTKEEYLRLTDYASLEEAKKDLKIIHVLFPVTLGSIALWVFSPVSQLLHPVVASIVRTVLFFSSTILAIICVWKCKDIRRKTRRVTKVANAHGRIWWTEYYRYLLEPLEIIAGERALPSPEFNESRSLLEVDDKRSTKKALRTIILVTVIGLLILLYKLNKILRG